MKAPMRTKRARRRAPQQQPSAQVPPAGWTVEDDRREEFLALSCLVAVRKVA